MLDYDREADRYDATRGGQARADAAADALDGLLGDSAEVNRILDVGAGTGIVSAALAARGREVFGADASRGMLVRAAERLPGRRVCADAARLPLVDGSFDGAFAMWLLHLVPDSAAVVAECLRVLRPGGTFVTSIEVHAAHQQVRSDVTEVLASFAHPGWERHETDERGWVVAAATAAGAEYLGEAAYVGHERGASPSSVARGMRRGLVPTGSMSEDERAGCVRELETLPDQDTARADPVYTLLAFAAR